MFTFLVVIHVIVCISLIFIILIQSGRRGGLIETFSGVESIFGPKTSTFLVRLTSVLATIFIITCLSLALLSREKSKSLMEKYPLQKQAPIEKH
jgi:preprotein translocase subunit SecG